jgi:hypothetical protein
MAEPWTGRENLSIGELFDRVELLNESVADALESVARQIRAGVTPANMVRLDTERLRTVYAYPTSFRDVYYKVHGEVRLLLTKQRANWR